MTRRATFTRAELDRALAVAEKRGEAQEEATAYSRSADLRRVVEGQRATVRKMR